MNAASSSIAPHRGCTVTITVMSVLSTGLGAVISVREPPCQPLVVFQGHCSGHKLEKRLAYTEVWVYDTQVSQSDRSRVLLAEAGGGFSAVALLTAGVDTVLLWGIVGC